MMQKKYNLWLQLAANTIPLIGFWFFGWNMFAIIYLFWFEGLILAFSNSVKIAFARGYEFEKTETAPFFHRFFSAIKNLLFRSGLLFFYLIFIFAFVAFPGGGIHKEMALQNLMVMTFNDRTFNNALIVYFLHQIIVFISDFIVTEDYKNKPSSQYKVLFDSRTIILHIVIVLGTFAYQFMEKYQTLDNKLPALSYVFILVVLKSIADIIQYILSGNSKENSSAS